MDRTSAAGLMLAVVAAALVAGCGASKETFNATITYVLEPTKELPEGLTTVAILDAGVKVDGSEDDDRAKKWAKISADLMESMIRDAAERHGGKLTVAKRRDTQKVLAEQDMKMSGMVAGGAAAQAAKLLDVQALITSDLNIRVEVKKSTKTTFDLTHVAAAAGHGWGAGSAGIGAREADAISRNMTLQCKYSMLDAGSGEAIFEYAPRPFRKMDSKKPSPVFGRSAGEADLDPVDEYIGNLVEQGTREFVSMFVPCEVTYAYELQSSGNENSAKGIAAMRADDLDAAMQLLKAAVAEDAEDHRSVFAMGVCCELMKDWEGALKHYQQAAGMRGIDEEDMTKYLAAKNRVKDHKDRIRKSQKK